MAGRTTFWTSTSSITVNGGTLQTGRLFEHTGVMGTISLSDPVGDAALTVGTNDGDSTFSGLIQDAGGGPGSLKKVGTGTLTLTGVNTYTGGTVISTGAVLANNATGSATGTGGVKITNGTFGGTGSAAGTTTVSGGTVAPGASAGVLTLDDVLFENGSTLAIELVGDGGVAGVDFDQLLANNTATIDPGSVLNLSYLGGFIAEDGDSFVILDAAAASLSGMFDTVNFPDAQLWFIDYDTPNGDVVVGIVPEPATLALLGLGLLLVGAGTDTRKRRPFNVRTHTPADT